MKGQKPLGRELAIEINGAKEKVFCLPGETLLHILRNKLDHTEVKEGCGKGDCGVCTILMNGIAVNSCLVMAYQAEDKQITTVRGMGTKKNLHPLQKQFIEKGAVQCGFCIPGQLLTAKALLEKNPSPSTENIQRALSGNLCRCTGYKKIIEAVKAVSAEHK